MQGKRNGCAIARASTSCRHRYIAAPSAYDVVRSQKSHAKVVQLASVCSHSALRNALSVAGPHREKTNARLETPMRIKAIGLAGFAAGMYAIPAVAHHSFAMFDASQLVSLEGTVKEFQWTNPHAWIILTVARP